MQRHRVRRARLPKVMARLTILIAEENAFEPHIYHVERLFEKDGAKTIWARQFFR